MNKTTLAAAILTLTFAASTARASDGEFRYMPEPAFDSIVNRQIELIEPQDAFLGVSACRVIDVPTFRALDLGEAVEALKPCVSAVAGRYNAQVLAKAEAAQVNEGSIVLETSGVELTAAVLRDLNYSLSLRDGKLLGHPAKVGRAEFKLQLQGANPVQLALKRCVLPMVVRKLETSEDFIAMYGRCITSDPALKVSEIRPAEGHPMAVTLLSDADTNAVRALNGSVTVNPGAGPVTVMVTAYPRTVFLPY